MSTFYKKKELQLFDNETGQIETAKYTQSITTAKDKRKFMKLYIENEMQTNPFEELMGLPTYARRLAIIIFKAYSNSKKDTDVFYLNYKEACLNYAYKKSKQEYYKSMKLLKDIGFINKTESHSLFKINDTWMYNGQNKNHLKLV